MILYQRTWAYEKQYVGCNQSAWEYVQDHRNIKHWLAICVWTLLKKCVHFTNQHVAICQSTTTSGETNNGWATDRLLSQENHWSTAMEFSDRSNQWQCQFRCGLIRNQWSRWPVNLHTFPVYSQWWKALSFPSKCWDMLMTPSWRDITMMDWCNPWFVSVKHVVLVKLPNKT